jgi:hypothetical protein
MSNQLKWLSAGSLALIGLSLILAWLDMGGFLNHESEFLGAKALEALNGVEPRYKAIVSVFPPLLIYGTLVLGSPVTLQVLVGALLIGLLIWKIGNLSVPKTWQRVWTALILFNPAFGLMLLRSPAWVMTAIFLTLQMVLLWTLAKPKGSPSLPSTVLLVLLGLGLAPLMLLRYESWLMLPVIALTLGVLFEQESWGFKSTAILVTLFMSLVFIGTWLYMNWLFTGDAYYFLNSSYSSLRLPETKAFLQQEGFWASWLQSFTWIVQVVPVYLLIVGWVLWQDKRWGLTILILLLPVIFLVAAFWQGTFMPELSRFGIFLGILPLILQQFPPPKLWQRLVFTGALVVSLLGSGALLQQNQFIPEETLLWRKLTQQALPSSLSVQQWVQQKQEQRQIAQVLYEKLLPGQRVLMDDAINFPIIYLVNDSSYFILPYQNEFFLALQQPNLFTDFILVPGPQTPGNEQDRLLSYWPQLAETTLPGFQEVFGTSHYRLLQRLNPP